VRGLSLLQDGAPINLADDNGDFQELDPAILDRLEVYRGASALRFGSSTLGGAINGITPNGRDAPGLQLRLDGGSFNTFRGVATYGVANETADAWIAASADSSDEAREHSSRESFRVNANVGVRLSHALTTRLYVTASRIRQDLPGALPYALAIARPKTGNLVGDQARDINSLRLQTRTTYSSGHLSAELGGYLNLKNLHHPIFQVIDQTSNDRGAYLRMRWKSAGIEVSSGLTARFGSIDSRRFVNVNGTAGARTFEADLNARTIDAFAEGRVEILPALTGVAGAVFTSGKRKQAQSFPLPITRAKTFDEISPRLGLIWQAQPDLQVYANVSRSHELPGFTELAQVASFVPLQAQHAWTGEVGTRGRVGPLEIDVSAYHARVRGELLQFSLGPDIPASTFNAQNTLHRGIEAGLKFPVGSLASVRSSYQFSDFRFDGDRQYGDNDLPVVPRHLLRGEVRFGTDEWHVSPAVEWAPRGAWADYSNSFRARGYATVRVSAAYGTARSAEIFVDVRNVAGTRAVGDVNAVVKYRFDDPSTPANEGSAIFNPIEHRAIFIGFRTRLGDPL